MVVINAAGSVATIPLPEFAIDPDDHDDEDEDAAEDKRDNPPSVVQLLGVLKVRNPARVSAESIAHLKRVAAGVGGASSGGYLLSNLAFNDNALIVLSTAPIIQQEGMKGSLFLHAFIPPDAFPSYKGDALDIEYVIVRKRLSDGHLAMSIVQVQGIMQCSSRIAYSRDCPACLGPVDRVDLDQIRRQLREGLLIDREALDILKRTMMVFPLPSPILSRSFNIKNDETDIAVLSLTREQPGTVKCSVKFISFISSLRLELLRLEIIDDLFTEDTDSRATSKLLARREFTGIDMLTRMDIDDLPDSATFISTICKSVIALRVCLTTTRTIDGDGASPQTLDCTLNLSWTSANPVMQKE